MLQTFADAINTSETQRPLDSPDVGTGLLNGAAQAFSDVKGILDERSEEASLDRAATSRIDAELELQGLKLAEQGLITREEGFKLSAEGEEAAAILAKAKKNGLNDPLRIAIEQSKALKREIGKSRVSASRIAQNFGISLATQGLSVAEIRNQKDVVKKEEEFLAKKQVEEGFANGHVFTEGLTLAEKAEEYTRSSTFDLVQRTKQLEATANNAEATTRARANAANGLSASDQARYTVELHSIYESHIKNAGGDPTRINQSLAVQEIQQRQDVIRAEINDKYSSNRGARDHLLSQIDEIVGGQLKLARGEAELAGISLESARRRNRIEGKFANERAESERRIRQQNQLINDQDIQRNNTRERIAIAELVKRRDLGSAELRATLRKSNLKNDVINARVAAFERGFDDEVEFIVRTSENPKAALVGYLDKNQEKGISLAESFRDRVANVALTGDPAEATALIDVVIDKDLWGESRKRELTGILLANLDNPVLQEVYAEHPGLQKLVPEFGEEIQNIVVENLKPFIDLVGDEFLAGNTVFKNNPGTFLTLDQDALNNEGIFKYKFQTNAFKALSAQDLRNIDELRKGVNLKMLQIPWPRYMESVRKVGKYPDNVTAFKQLTSGNLLLAGLLDDDFDVNPTFKPVRAIREALGTQEGIDARVEEVRRLQERIAQLEAPIDPDNDTDENSFVPPVELSPDPQPVAPEVDNTQVPVTAPAIDPSKPVPQPKLAELAESGGFQPEEARIMAAIAMAESAGKADALNDDRSTGDDSYGLWQINMIDREGFLLGEERRAKLGLEDNSELFDPITNVRAAKLVFDEQGFEAWSVFRSGKYKDFL